MCSEGTETVCSPRSTSGSRRNILILSTARTFDVIPAFRPESPPPPAAKNDSSPRAAC